MEPSLPGAEPLAPNLKPSADLPKGPPICDRCPQCGCPDFFEARPEGWIAFKKDRLCVKCHKRYALPTPSWARVVFYIVGGLLLLVFGGDMLLRILYGDTFSLVTSVPFILLGVASVGFAIRAGQQKVLSAPEWTGPVREKPQPRPSTPAERRTTIITLTTVALFVGGMGALFYFGSKADARRKADEPAIRDLQLIGGIFGAGTYDPTILHLWKMERQLTDDELALVRNLDTLTCLNIASTEVTDMGVANLAKLTRLDRLVLNCERVTDAGVASLPAMPRLDCLHLRHTQITDAALGSLPNLAGLKDLDLMFTEVTDEGVARLAPATKLETLNLCCAPVTAQAFAALGDLQQLKTLVLSYTEVGDNGFENFLALRGLEELLLHKTEITDASVPVLKQLKSLKLLGVGGTGLTREGVVEVKRALPKCWVTTIAGEPEDEER